MRILILLLLTSCGQYNPCDSSLGLDMLNYSVEPTEITPNGILVDGEDIDLDLVDAIVGAVERCLDNMFPDGYLTDEVLSDSFCIRRKVNLPIQGITIKIPSEYRTSVIDGQQLLNSPAPEQGCIDKGICESPCECYWRCGIQDTCTIVVTPSLYMLPDPLVKLATDCYYVWGSLAECAQPLVEKNGDYDLEWIRSLY